ncbi:AraC family transcriptional regulator [Neptunitalea chrysea]|uniref:AraC family transcriptional regulator n=1 Tax=Neptunitalea chrysea TaxID=1647581 RepID=A0A9W6B8G0_9FLAO|nr:AraC family transcriptional regulator [Neptunitalea chrysea]GLB53655.1 AraC family transcriptional regulator [Neptunitalea chrysea]
MTEALKTKYYLTEVDKQSASVYCYHDLMGEVFIEPHVHKKGQFIYTEGGVVFIKTETKTHYLPARHYMWIPPGVEHSIYPSSPKVIMRNLYFPIKSLDNSYFYKEGIYPVNNLLFELLLYTKNWKGDILSKNKSRFTIVMAFKVLIEQSATQTLLLNLPQATDDRLKKIIKYISTNVQHEHSLTLLATRYGVSEKTLYRLFKKDVGMPFIRYFALLRIFKSLEYLVDNDYTIAEIANKVGYSSVPTFSTTFCKIIGKRPSEYRKANEIY